MQVLILVLWNVKTVSPEQLTQSYLSNLNYASNAVTVCASCYKLMCTNITKSF